jgi:hypothetical protein
VAARNLYFGNAGRRADARLCARHAVDLSEDATHARAAPVGLPITQEEVRIIASPGFPLWEPVDTLQLRNHRITLAYGDLSHRLARLIAGSDDKGTWDANWCTFATWSSKTIGTCIDRQPEHGLIHYLVRHLPSPLRSLFFEGAERLLCRGHGAIYRTLAVGNRLVFLEIATAVSHFVEYCGSTVSTGADLRFDAYWGEVETFLVGLRQLDPSWVATPAPDPRTLRAGMQAYLKAHTETDPKARAEQVLLGNLLLGAYEQTRVEDYLIASLSFFTTTWLHRLLRGPGPGVLARVGRGLAAPLNGLYALFATRFFLALEIPTSNGMAELMVGRPVPPIDPLDGQLDFPAVLRHLANPELQAVLTRYDLSDRKESRTRARNWSSFADRMNYITNLFRSRQRNAPLFENPWTAEQEVALLDGRLP